MSDFELDLDDLEIPGLEDQIEEMNAPILGENEEGIVGWFLAVVLDGEWHINMDKETPTASLKWHILVNPDQESVELGWNRMVNPVNLGFGQWTYTWVGYFSDGQVIPPKNKDGERKLPFHAVQLLKALGQGRVPDFDAIRGRQVQVLVKNELDEYRSEQEGVELYRSNIIGYRVYIEDDERYPILENFEEFSPSARTDDEAF